MTHHIQFLIHQHHHILLGWAAHCDFFSQSVLMSGIALTQK